MNTSLLTTALKTAETFVKASRDAGVYCDKNGLNNAARKACKKHCCAELVPVVYRLLTEKVPTRV